MLHVRSNVPVDVSSNYHCARRNLDLLPKVKLSQDRQNAVSSLSECCQYPVKTLSVPCNTSPLWLII